MSIQNRVRQRRVELNIPIRRICAELGVAKSTYEGWEINSYPSRPEYYRKLAEILKVTTEFLMFGTKRMQVAEDLLVHLIKYVDVAIDERLKGRNIK